MTRAALRHFLEPIPCLWQEPGQVRGRVLQAGMVRPQLSEEMLPRSALAPELQLEWLQEVAQPLQADIPPCQEWPPGLPLHLASIWLLKMYDSCWRRSGSASLAGPGVARGEKIPHLFFCLSFHVPSPQKQDTARTFQRATAQEPPQDVLLAGRWVVQGQS